jgi:hypothetical protein
MGEQLNDKATKLAIMKPKIKADSKWNEGVVGQACLLVDRWANNDMIG